MRLFSAVSRYSGLVALACVAFACASPERRTAKITDHRAYLLAEAPEQFDITALEGRRVLIDPGHGGPRPGAVGPNGVREADVNLGVGLHLWGLLKEAGADVHLTRTADTDVSELENPTLKQDLQARAALATELNPEVFISIHHNADIIPGSKKNDLETYYQLRQPGPSLDLAQAIHRHLARNTGERPNLILPGNFHVIRETDVPAILGEGSYVSSVENAEHIAFAAMQRLEAEAYFLGLVEYFSRGVPRVTATSPAQGDTLDTVSAITAEFLLDRDVPMDPGTVQFTINGEMHTGNVQRIGNAFTALLLEPLPSGDHHVEVVGRNTRGNSSRLEGLRFSVQAAVDRLVISTQPETVSSAGDKRSIISVRAEDMLGRAVRDGEQITLETSSGTIEPEIISVRDGVARAIWSGQDVGLAIITARHGEVSSSRSVGLVGPDDEPPSWVVQVVDAVSGDPVNGAAVQAGRAMLTTASDGYVLVDGGDQSLRVSAPGYWPTLQAGLDKPRVQLPPVVGGVLQGVSIAIDPADGGADSGARGPTGLRAADINLRIARYLAEYLRSAGAVPLLTRSGDATTSVFERVEASEAGLAARFVSIRCGATGGPGRVLDASGYATSADFTTRTFVEHYPTSSGGRALARRLQQRLSDLSVAEHPPETVQSVAYELTHTSCPAVRVQPLTPLQPEHELRLSEPAEQRRIAYAIFLALAEDFGAEPGQVGQVAGSVVDEAGQPISGAAVYLNETWLAITDTAGGFAFSMLPTGTVAISASAPGMATKHLMVDVAAGDAAHALLQLSPSP